jgi:hypothetical protein
MVNLLEMLYAITAVAVLTAIYSAMRERKTQIERDRYKGALWMSGIGTITCALLYWYLSR